MIKTSTLLPRRAAAVVVGAGLSGMVAARELEAAGCDDLVVLEARDRVGGLLKGFERENGRVLMEGAEFTGAFQPELQALADELGIEREPLPMMGRLVRVDEAGRHVEDRPLGEDPEALQAHGAAMGQLGAMAAQVPVDAPWSAPQALEWDHLTVAQWLDDNVPSRAARRMLECNHFGDSSTMSLLHLLWEMARFHAAAPSGGDGLAGFLERFVGGTAQIPIAIAEQLSAPVHTSVPVRAVHHRPHGATIVVDGGASLDADVVVVAMDPGLVARIDFHPSLPPLRADMQNRWVTMHEGKYYVIYDEPFWRADGLSGTAFGPPPFEIVMDASPSDADEGVLVVRRAMTPRQWRTSPYDSAVDAYADAVADPAVARELILEQLAVYFGEQARRPREFHAFEWSADPWSRGCGTYLPIGLLSTLGEALTPPVGPIVWAGADTGGKPAMEGAVAAGRRASREASELLGRHVRGDNQVEVR